MHFTAQSNNTKSTKKAIKVNTIFMVVVGSIEAESRISVSLIWVTRNAQHESDRLDRNCIVVNYDFVVVWLYSSREPTKFWGCVRFTYSLVCQRWRGATGNLSVNSASHHVVTFLRDRLCLILMKVESIMCCIFLVCIFWSCNKIFWCKTTDHFNTSEAISTHFIIIMFFFLLS